MGALYKYDPLGSFERLVATCSGKGEKMIQTMLDEHTLMNADDSLWPDLSNSHTNFLHNANPISSTTVHMTGSTADNEERPSGPKNEGGPSGHDNEERPSGHERGVERDQGRGSRRGGEGGSTWRSGIPRELGRDEAVELVVKAFRAAAEREITIGDGIDIWILESGSHAKHEQQQQQEEGEDHIVEKEKGNMELMVEKRMMCSVNVDGGSRGVGGESDERGAGAPELTPPLTTDGADITCRREHNNDRAHLSSGAAQLATSAAGLLC